ncbi:MAG: hypothetical protein J2P53_17400 [Bradyrhizobiaceae bacterium]|nr:hypothetical protein [Bradyrhizobiaceae bacterium]
MRMLLALLAIAVTAGAGHAQDAGGGHKGRGSRQKADTQTSDPQKKKQIEDAYRSAIKRIPDAKEKYDPWKNAR